MFFIIIALVLLGSQAFLILTTKFTFWPEITTFSWLVSKGLIPYRDFFDHHGFLLYYFLAPLMKDTSFWALKVFFLILQSINLLLVLLIIRRKKNKISFLIGGTLFIFLNYFVNVNTLWYEGIITAFILAAYYLNSKKRKNIVTQIFLGYLISLASFLKPTAGLFIFPIICFEGGIIPLITFIISWISVFIWYYLNGGLHLFFNNLFLFNIYLSKNYHNTYYSDYKFHVSVLAISLLILFFCWKTKKIQNILQLFVWMVLSLIFVFYLYNRPHMVPLISFFVIMISAGLSLLKGNYKRILISLLIIFLIFSGRKVYTERNSINSSIPWFEQITRIEIINTVKVLNIENKNVYIFGNQGDLYIALNQLPPTKYPLIFPMMNRYIPEFENKIIYDLRKNKVTMIIVPKPIEDQFMELMKIRTYINENYLVNKNTKDFEIFVRK